VLLLTAYPRRVPTPASVATHDVLLEPQWCALEQAHQERVDAWVQPHLQRRARGERHAVHDFLFTYYANRPAQLRRWHPGVGRALLGDAARERLDWPLYAQVQLTGPDGRWRPAVALDLPAYLAKRADTVHRIAELLAATAARTPQLGCFGLHEWAMVYRQPAEEIRHGALPLRLGAEGTDRVVESARIRCTHFDAFRFFTEPARPLNVLQPTRADQVALEQPGCLHATMDLYKAAFMLGPAVPGELLGDCFELAVAVRELDMRASPYDLRSLGLEPVRIETAEGKAEYVEHQRAFAARGQRLRAALLRVCEQVTTNVPADRPAGDIGGRPPQMRSSA
jgi:hypothetical protein